MKTIKRYIAVLVIVALGGLTAAAERVLKDVPSIDGVTSVYVGKFALKAMKSGTKIGDVDLKGLVRDLDGVEVLSTDDPVAEGKLKAEISRVLGSYRPPLELMVETAEGDESMKIYGAETEGDIIKCIIIVEEEPDEISVIVLTGNISADKLDRMIDID